MPSEQNSEPNVLVVAGLRNRDSLSWAVVEPWLSQHPSNEVVATYKHPRAEEFIMGQNCSFDNRLHSLKIDWLEQADKAPELISEKLTELYGDSQVVNGALHSVARARRETFTTPAHVLTAAAYTEAYTISTASLQGLAKGVNNHLRENAGIVTFGYGQSDRIETEYGGPMTVAKAALSCMVDVLAESLGKDFPHARVAEIRTGFIPTNSGRGVASSLDSLSTQIISHFEKCAFIPTSPTDQKIAAGRLALDFMANLAFHQSTGEHYNVDGGRGRRGLGLLPNN